MTPPEHLIVGMASAATFYSALHFNRNQEKKPFGFGKVLFVMAVAAMLPDIDSFYGEYTSKNPWIGHRGMTHSFVGVGVLGLALTLVTNLIALFLRFFPAYWKFWFNFFKQKAFPDQPVSTSVFKFWLKPFFPKPFLLLFLASFIGGITHLLCDLPQAGSVWGGLPLLFPFKSAAGEYARFGGYSLMGWYDLKIAWVFIGALVISLPAVIIGRVLAQFKHKVLKIITVVWFALIFIFTGFVYYWTVDYLKKSKYTDDKAWYQYQMKFIETAPEIVKNPSKEAFKIGLSLFKQYRGLGG